MLSDMVPKQDDLAPSEISDSLNAKFPYVREVSISNNEIKSTYFFPVGSCRGLISTLLNHAKKSSQGAAS